MTQTNYKWKDNPTVSGVSTCDTDVLNDCLMHLKYNQTGSVGHYIGELVYSPFPILNELGKTPDELHLADGSLISSVEYGGFASWLEKLIVLYPALFKTEEEWQAVKTEYGEAAAFVIDEEAHTIRLPLIVNPIKGVTDFTDLGKVVEAGLPNIEGNIALIDRIGTSGAFLSGVMAHYAYSVNGAGRDSFNTSFDASRSNPIYGKSDTVQPQQPTGCIYIVLATGVDQNIKAVQEIEVNDSRNLLDVMWSDKIINNPSWLLSQGQANSYDIYAPVYNMILEEYNKGTDLTETVGGIEITYRRGENDMKITTDKSAFDSILTATGGTAWYYVLDIPNQEFYLPQMNGFSQFAQDGAGDYVEAGLPNITGNVVMSPLQSLLLNGTSTVEGAFKISSTTRRYRTPGSDDMLGADLEFDASLSNPIYGKSDTVQPPAVKGYLYFYAGNTVVNAQLIDVGKAIGKMAEKLDANHSNDTKPYVTETYKNGTSWYRLWSDGWCEQGGTTKEQQIYFLKPYVDTNYSFASIVSMMNGAAASNDMCYTGKNNNYITVQLRYGGTAKGALFDFMWISAGYIS